MDYQAELERIALDAVKEAVATGYDERDIVSETISGHEWVIYAYHAQQVLDKSNSTDEAYELVTECMPKLYSEFICQMAYWCMERDVQEHIEAYKALAPYEE